MRPLTLDSGILLPSILCALLWSAGASQSDAQTPPCTPAQSGSSNQKPAQAAQQFLSAVNNLKSALGGKNASQPCSPAATAAPVSMASAPSAPAQASAANYKAPIPPTVAYTSSLIPPAPAGGLDPSKLPDLIGIHIGDSTDRVLAAIDKLYPQTGAGRSNGLRTQGYAYTNDPFYPSSMSLSKRNMDGCAPNDCRGDDSISALFSGPPEQRAVELQRGLSWPTNQPTMATLRAAFIQKYGQTFEESNAGGLTMTWLFDEEGKPMPPQSRLAAMNCGGMLAFGGGPSQRLPDYLFRSPPPQVVTQEDLDRFAKISCGRKIWVNAQVFGQPGGMANSMQLTIREYAVDLRDAFAAENFMRQAKLAQGSQQLKNAQQQAAPAF